MISFIVFFVQYMDNLEVIGTNKPVMVSKHSMSTVPEEEEPEPENQLQEEGYATGLKGLESIIMYIYLLSTYTYDDEN